MKYLKKVGAWFNIVNVDEWLWYNKKIKEREVTKGQIDVITFGELNEAINKKVKKLMAYDSNKISEELLIMMDLAFSSGYYILLICAGRKFLRSSWLQW